MLTGCGQSKVAKKEMRTAIDALESARKTRCPHESMPAAERAYAEAQRYFKEERYNKARAQARIAKQYAEEVTEAHKDKPCDPLKDVNLDDKNKSKASDLANSDVSPFESEELPDLAIIFFKFDSHQLTSDARNKIEENLAWIRENKEIRIVLGGHCDSRGGHEYNIALSEKRARAIEGYLLQAGVDERQLEIVGYGSELPRSHLTTEKGHRENRRVEFSVAKPK